MKVPAPNYKKGRYCMNCRAVRRKNEIWCDICGQKTRGTPTKKRNFKPVESRPRTLIELTVR